MARMQMDLGKEYRLDLVTHKPAGYHIVDLQKGWIEYYLDWNKAQQRFHELEAAK